MPLRVITVTYRDVGLSLGVVQSEIQWCVSIEESEKAFGPEGWDEVLILKPPVKAEYPVEV